MKELKPAGNDIQMSVPHENRFSPAVQPAAKTAQKEEDHE